MEIATGHRIETLRAAGRLVERILPGGQVTELVEKNRPWIDLRGVQKGENTVDVVASDETPDRYGDVVEASGWDLEAYRRNPVVLIDHRYAVSEIVGTADRVEVFDRALVAQIVLDPPEANPTAGMVRARLEAGSLRTVSVGFLPVSFEPIVDTESGRVTGYRFLEQELLEISFVAVPANPNAATV
jgi:HK97 family phage prohead protease